MKGLVKMEIENMSPVLLQFYLKNDTISQSDFAELNNYMKKETRLKKVCDLSKVKCRASDGRYYIYINRQQIIAPTYPQLLDKLTDFYFGPDTLSLKDILADWMIWRRDTTKVKNKTLKDNLLLWNSLYRDTEIVMKPISQLTTKDFTIFFRILTKNGTLTRKKFNDGKSILNSMFAYAIEVDIAESNPIVSVNFRSFNYRPENHTIKTYSLDERKVLLDYMKDMDDIYSLAIQFHFRIVARIGELKALRWDDIEGNNIRIQRQIIEEQTMNDDLTFNPRDYRVVEYAKGHTSDGFRDMPLTPQAKAILEKVKALNLSGEYIFMVDKTPLMTETYNRHLIKYCETLNIKYKSSHKLRFCVASALYAEGVPATKIQKLLGHSTLAMTLHYLRDVTPENDCYDSMVQVLDC